MFNENILPLIYEMGSLGASGDLAPLAHLTLPLIGLGEVFITIRIFSGEAINQKLQWTHKPGSERRSGVFEWHSVHECVWALVHASRTSFAEAANIIGALSLDAFDGRLNLSCPGKCDPPTSRASRNSKRYHKNLTGKRAHWSIQETCTGSLFIPLYPPGSWCIV